MGKEPVGLSVEARNTRSYQSIHKLFVSMGQGGE